MNFMNKLMVVVFTTLTLIGTPIKTNQKAICQGIQDSTLKLKIEENLVYVELYGIQVLNQQTKTFLTDRIVGRSVLIAEVPVSGAHASVVLYNGVNNVNALVFKSGLASFKPRAGQISTYYLYFKILEKLAQEEKIGIWALKNTTTQGGTN